MHPQDPKESTAEPPAQGATQDEVSSGSLGASGAELQVAAPNILPAVGDYVLATKYGDGDPGDPWALGFYAGELDMGNDRCEIKVAPRYAVNGSDGRSIRPNGYRRVARIRKDVGHWLLKVAAEQLERSPPGTVSLWTMLTPAAFDIDSDPSATAPIEAASEAPSQPQASEREHALMLKCMRDYGPHGEPL
jgi:hypothetical protein